MSLKCSVFGHRFGEPEIDRSRDESGSEVVITIQERQTCERCGHERIVSENKEVTALETSEPDAEEAAEPAHDDGRVPAEPATEGGDGGTILAESEPPVGETESDPPDLAAAEAESDDDGIILEDGNDADAQPDREPGAWPEEPDDAGQGWTPPEPDDDATDSEGDLTVEPTGEAITVPEGRFRCPSCGFTTPVESSSLREGDFCPACHTGSLAHERGGE